MRRGRRFSTGRNNQAISGEHNVIDDISGFKFKSSDMRKLSGDQKGLITSVDDWNPPQPQLHIRPRKEDVSVRNARVRSPDVFEADASGNYAFQNGDTYHFNDVFTFEITFN